MDHLADTVMQSGAFTNYMEKKSSPGTNNSQYVSIFWDKFNLKHKFNEAFKELYEMLCEKNPLF